MRDFTDKTCISELRLFPGMCLNLEVDIVFDVTKDSRSIHRSLENK